MKSLVRKALTVIICIFVANVGVMASNDKPITVSQLPQAAQHVLKTEFKGRKVALSKMESGLISKSYDVIFTNGDKIEFDRNGNWTDIECKKSGVPANLVPSQIRQYVKKNYSSQRIVEIEKKRGSYEVKLSKGVELTFNKNFKVTHVDMD